MKRHVDIKVEGGVQGVGFRWAAQAQACRAGLTGFVRNEEDGSVMIEAEGSDSDLEILVNWCRHGPPSATVERVAVTPGSVQGFSTFEIRF